MADTDHLPAQRAMDEDIAPLPSGDTAFMRVATAGEAARKIPRAQRTAAQKRSILEYLKTFGPMTPDWEAELSSATGTPARSR